MVLLLLLLAEMLTADLLVVLLGKGGTMYGAVLAARSSYVGRGSLAADHRVLLCRDGAALHSTTSAVDGGCRKMSRSPF